METFKRTWAEIDLSALQKNYETVRRQVGDGVQVMAVVKANAYGHGVEHVAPFLDTLGAHRFGVSCLQEALELRQMGIQKPILILGYTPAEYFPLLAEYDLTQTVFCREDGEHLSRIGETAGRRIRVHLALDTGMGRIGFDAFDAEKAAEEVAEVAALPGLLPEGLFTHFAVADTDGEEAYTEAQFRRFIAVRDRLLEKGMKFLCHVANSAGTFLNKEYHLDMVRAGIVLYGLEPGGRDNPYWPVMSVKTRIAMVKTLPAGRDISYGRRYTTEKTVKVATLTAGYADGYPRALSGKGEVVINGFVAPIIGTVCMDQMMADVTGIPCQAGDEAVLIGAPLDLNRLASEAKTIHYELVCGVSKRVPRVVKKV